MQINKVQNSNTTFGAKMSLEDVAMIKKELSSGIKCASDKKELNDLKNKTIIFDNFLKDIKQEKNENDVFHVCLPYANAICDKQLHLFHKKDSSLNKKFPVELDINELDSFNNTIIRSIPKIFSPENAKEIKKLENEAIEISALKKDTIEFTKDFLAVDKAENKPEKKMTFFQKLFGKKN